MVYYREVGGKDNANKADSDAENVVRVAYRKLVRWYMNIH